MSGFATNCPVDQHNADVEPFDRILNFRDVGRFVNHFLGSSILKEGLLFRSARPDDASSLDRQRLTNEYGITTVIDLRTKSEHIKQSQKQDRDVQAAVVQSNDATAEPLKIPGLDYKEINFNGGAFERALFSNLSGWSRTKVITLMMFGYRMEAISIMGKEVLQPRGLIGLGCDSIDFCIAEIRQTFELFADPSSYPILVHCTQAAVTGDYLLSESELLPEKEDRLKEIEEVGLTEDFANTPADWVEKMNLHLSTEYGGISEYLSGIGVSLEMQTAIRLNLCRDP